MYQISKHIRSSSRSAGRSIAEFCDCRRDTEGGQRVKQAGDPGSMILGCPGPHRSCQYTLAKAIVLSAYLGTTAPRAPRFRGCDCGVVAHAVATVPPGSGKLSTPARRSPSVRTMRLIHLSRLNDTRSTETSMNVNAGEMTTRGAVTLVLGLTLVAGGGQRPRDQLRRHDEPLQMDGGQ
jgi:hypothetical protein